MPPQCGSYITRNLLPGEQVIVTTRISSAVLIGPKIGFFLGIVIAVAGLVLVNQSGTKDQFLTVAALVPGGLLALTSAWTWVGRWVERLTTEFVCTDRRILIKSGLLATDLEEMLLTKVEALKLDQGVLGKLLGYASLKVTGSGGTKRKCENIERPHEFYRCIQEQLNLVQRR